jgi:hypothetical protein
MLRKTVAGSANEIIPSSMEENIKALADAIYGNAVPERGADFLKI